MNQYRQDDRSINHLDLHQPRRMAGHEPTQGHSRLVSLQLGKVLLIFLAFVDQRGRFRSSVGSHGRCVPDVDVFVCYERIEWLTKMAQLQRGSVVVGGWRRWIGQMQRQQAALLNLALYLIPTPITRPLKKNAEKIRKIRRHTTDTHHLARPGITAFLAGKKTSTFIFGRTKHARVKILLC
jgi:hypothetical protein